MSRYPGKFSYQEIMTLFEVLSSKNKNLDTNYTDRGFDPKEDKSILDYDIRSVKLEVRDDVKAEFKINKSIDNSIK